MCEKIIGGSIFNEYASVIPLESKLIVLSENQSIGPQFLAVFRKKIQMYEKMAIFCENEMTNQKTSKGDDQVSG